MAEKLNPSFTFTDDRLNELKSLFPEAFEDGQLNLDTLQNLIGDFSIDQKTKEHFGLNWVGKRNARIIAAKPPTGTLIPCINEGKNENSSDNIFIEGENFLQVRPLVAPARIKVDSTQEQEARELLKDFKSGNFGYEVD